MRIKSYFSHTVEDAMAQAARELGTEAMLVKSRRSPPEARHLGAYEVVFASNPPPEEAPAGSEAAHASSPPSPRSSGDRLSQEVAELKRELDGMRRTIAQSPSPTPQWAETSPDHSDAYGVLAESGMDQALAREIVQAAEVRAAGPRLPVVKGPLGKEPANFERALVEEMSSRFTVQAALGKGEGSPRIVALVGPPGAGKTTTLVKLAANYGLSSRRPVLLLSVDTYRVAAAEQLRSYAAILGVGFQVLETVTALAQSIEENRGKDLIFIDTPGLAPGDMDQFPGLAQFLSTRTDIDSQLVVSSSMKSADLSRVVDTFEVFRPQRLLFTRLDETSSFGPILNEAARTGKPLSFFTTGQRIPEDLEAASRDRLVELVLAGRRGQVLSAA